ncbi:unnamed protein product [Caenorhabditis auriculariae]|uniref:Uncharacterized protein n=1 Tax=Caenorhabditis auriculariae TaxID=2777116 RepID=A0A8S1GWU8_9PELO|nr:unnamed protein product [Caenorhabditis auriculariae]
MDLFRRPKKRGGAQQAVRQRDSGDSDEDGIDIQESVKKRRRDNPMVQSTKKRVENTVASSSSGSDNDYDDKIAVAEHSFASSGTTGPSGPRDQGATATLEVDTDYAADAQAQFERVQKQLKEGLEKDGKVLYKGSAMYGAREAKDTAKGNASSGLNRVGPIRAPQFLRQTVRWDFAPDICKDYKETGYCTFGDSCKFVHDRSDYKHGWEIEQDYLEGKHGEDDEVDYEIHEEEDQYPEECYICGQAFKDPIITKCKHYFCEQCAMKSFRKSKKCPICNENTLGIMNIAKDMIAHLKKKKLEEEQKDKVSNDDEETGTSGKPDEEPLQMKSEEAEEVGAPSDDSRDSDGNEDFINEVTEEEEEVEIQMENVEEIFGGENDDDSGSEDEEEDEDEEETK